ncbi:hypothetical protein ASF98_09735 [Arthrobacter sp. Leaf337]|uniref:hypothetical protein n=1 Tax=Arthrobacter sp. Leaf337 TaxID=1736342 RepID=UPI0006F9000F|nr:hypothetical protein [Arthrobacter sp. Leaf337]KQR65396.1 hypothetical protein ASF98_09735 [Arthrobacter sp. Leaf337]
MSGRHNTSSPECPRGFRRGLVLFQRLIRRGIAVCVALVLAVLLGAPAASAYWSATGKGSTTAAVTTLAPPTNVTVPSSSNSNVSVSWTGSAGTPAATGYFVSRITGSTSVLACGSSPASPIAGTSCTDSSVPEGTHTYLVTAVHRSWTAVSAASGNVTVNNMDTINFIVQPAASATAGASLQGVTVELRTALGLKLMKPGVQMTIGIGNNPGGGTLSGTLTATTDTWGEATFTGLSINKAGTGYTLLASSPGVSGSVSAPFTVTAAAAAQLVVTGPAAGTASAAANIGPFTVQRQDAYGNPVIAGNTALTLSSNSSGTKLFATTAGGSAVTTVTIVAGSASASFYYGDTKAGSYSVSITAAGLAQVSTPVNVSASTAAIIEFVQGPVGTANGQTMAPVTAQVLDAFRNPLITSANPVTITKVEQSGNLRGATPQYLAGGLATFSGLSITGKGAYHLMAHYGTLSVTSAGFNIT